MERESLDDKTNTMYSHSSLDTIFSITSSSSRQNGITTDARLGKNSHLLVNRRVAEIEKASACKVNGRRDNRGCALRGTYTARDIVEFVDMVDQALDEEMVSSVQEYFKEVGKG